MSESNREAVRQAMERPDGWIEVGGRRDLQLKNRLAAFGLGIFLAWVGLPFGVHLAYWVAIATAFFLGRHF